MLTGEHGQAVTVNIVSQQDVAVVVGKGAEHVVAVLRSLHEDAVLVRDERREHPQHQHNLHAALADGCDALAH